MSLLQLFLALRLFSDFSGMVGKWVLNFCVLGLHTSSFVYQKDKILASITSAGLAPFMAVRREAEEEGASPGASLYFQ
jgi:hypothetical protein